MNTLTTNSFVTEDVATIDPAMYAIFKSQQAAYRNNPLPTLSERIDRLNRLKNAILKNKEAFAEAISKDFNGRSIYETKLGEIMTLVEQVNDTQKHLADWMKTQKRKTNTLHLPNKSFVELQPLGVVGILSPWNYPLILSLGPLVSALAAGNHAMLKISSASAHYGKLLEQTLADVFPKDTVAIINGGGQTSDIFTALPFDLICFTGSPTIAKTVMAAAAKNLTPVVLELGGKSPAVIHAETDMKEVAERLTFGKFWNSGQTCIAPDYALVPQGKTTQFIMEMTKRISHVYPKILKNPDYTSIVNEKQHSRLMRYLDDAKSKGAEITVINPSNEDFSNSYKIPPTFVTKATPDMLICTEEIFGPIMPVLEYQTLGDAIEYINDRPRPLALYYFDHDEQRIQYIINNTHSGHVGINAPLVHFTQDDLPFGGIGNSGMGKLHGKEGFLTMSHARSVHQAGKFFSAMLITAPFGKRQDLLLKAKLR